MGLKLLHAVTVVVAVLIAITGRATGRVEQPSRYGELDEQSGIKPIHDSTSRIEPEENAGVSSLEVGRKRRAENILKGTERRLSSRSSSSKSSKKSKKCGKGSSKSSKSSSSKSDSCDDEDSEDGPTAAPARSFNPASGAITGPTTLNPALAPAGQTNDDIAIVFPDLFLNPFDQARTVTNDAFFSSAVADVFVFEDDFVCVVLDFVDLTSGIEAVEIYFGEEDEAGSLELEIVPISEDALSETAVENNGLVRCALGNPTLTEELLLFPELFFINVSTEDNIFGEVRSQLD